ncbi:MAG: hypothetical protein RIS47_1164 [Bacteroidota bacterium]|jgi:Rrf2 family protein
MFNKETEYAIRALVYIQVQNGESSRPGIEEIAKEIDAPKFYVAKILQRLVKQGVIQSIKGKGGGFYFEKDRAGITIKEIINLIEPSKDRQECGFGLKQCDANNPCPFHDKYAPIRNSIDELITSETVLTLAQKYILKTHRTVTESE